MRFLALFLLIPLFEVVVFIQVGGQIGALWTILLTLATAVTGVTLVKTQGIRTFTAAKAQLAQGETPAMAVVEGILLLLAGVMLMIPGFISDAMGALMLLPFARRALAGTVLEKVFIARANQAQPGHKGHTIEGQFRRDD
ncbi:hypothetical protein A9Q73_02505 [Bermanella sp. 47_1433_sub80_T6]|nr:hypothetical protein A9Q73_02505 [Bermanella sp. 47_1433_sub80_T6]